MNCRKVLIPALTLPIDLFLRLPHGAVLGMRGMMEHPADLRFGMLPPVVAHRAVMTHGSPCLFEQTDLGLSHDTHPRFRIEHSQLGPLYTPNQAGANKTARLHAILTSERVCIPTLCAVSTVKLKLAEPTCTLGSTMRKREWGLRSATNSLRNDSLS